MRLLLVRHGETEWSRGRRHTGSTDVPLTAEGRRQAALLRAPLAGHQVQRVLSSPMSRALDTCALAGLAEHADVRDELREFDYGDYEGRTTAEIREERPGWYLWRDGCPGGETPARVAERVGPLIEELRAGRADAALFAHGHVLRALTARWLGLGPAAGGLFALDTATISTLGYEREVPVIRAWNLRA